MDIESPGGMGSTAGGSTAGGIGSTAGDMDNTAGDMGSTVGDMDNTVGDTGSTVGDTDNIAGGTGSTVGGMGMASATGMGTRGLDIPIAAYREDSRLDPDTLEAPIADNSFPIELMY